MPITAARFARCLAAIFAFTFAFNTATAQTDSGNAAQDDEVIDVETKLVTVPVIVHKRDGSYLPDVTQDELTIQEDGVEQRIAFFAATKEPFHVVLLLDTSASTEEKLGQIRRAAAVFVAQLNTADRVKLISFDDTVKDAGDFTNDRAAIDSRIAALRPGRGTKLYDAFASAIRALQPIKGRKAIVVFTDGVDYRSDNASYDQNRRALQETGIIVYPIRFDTRRETEALAREQARSGGSGGQIVDLATILGGGQPGDTQPRGTTPTTFPGGTTTIPTNPSTLPGGTRDPLGLPIPDIFNRRRRDDTYPGDDRRGGNRRGDDRRIPDASDDGRGRYPDSNNGDYIAVMLDRLYKTADAYLEDLARESGGRLLRADTLGSLPAAFEQIAAELRTQYSLGYYPTNAARDGRYRKIKVRTTRKGVAVRAKPGYRAPRG